MTMATEGLYLREAPAQTLADLARELDQPREEVVVDMREVRLEDTPQDGRVLRLGNEKVVEASNDSLLALGGYLQIPAPFQKRLQPDEIEFLFNSRARNTPGGVAFTVADGEVIEVLKPGQRVIDPRRIVEVAQRTLAEDAPVVEAHEGDEFGFDTIVPTDFSGLGDPQVGDVTRAGLRFYQDRKHNLAPSVQPYTFTLICTNGMECQNPGLRIDARNQTVEDVLEELELAAQRAFAEVEGHISAMYDLRNQPVENPDRALRARAQEAGLSDRVTMRMMERFPALVADDADVTMFDIVNVVTNQANDPGLRLATRRDLERLGGQMVADHAARCGHCQQRVAH